MALVLSLWDPPQAALEIKLQEISNLTHNHGPFIIPTIYVFFVYKIIIYFFLDIRGQIEHKIYTKYMFLQSVQKYF